MKPKARLINGQWVVWDGVNFGNGFSQAKSLEESYRFYICGKAAINGQSFGRMFRRSVVIDFSKTFEKEYTRETK